MVRSTSLSQSAMQGTKQSLEFEVRITLFFTLLHDDALSLSKVRHSMQEVRDAIAHLIPTPKFL